MLNSVEKKRILFIFAKNTKHMKRLFYLFFLFTGLVTAQNKHEITIEIEGLKDTLVYLTIQEFENNLIKDTCKTVKNGKIVFKGKKNLETGIFALISQDKKKYFDFYVDANSQFTKIKGVNKETGIENLSSSNALQNEFFDYVAYISKKRVDFDKAREAAKGMSKKDSTDLIQKKYTATNDEVIAREESISTQYPGSYLKQLMALKKEVNYEKFAATYTDKKQAYQPYKKAFWEGINLDDESTIRNPFFVPKLKRYFTNVIEQTPDSVIVEVDKFLVRPKKESLIYKYLIAFFTNQYETSKILGQDKVFVHMSDAYFKTGKVANFFEKYVIESVIRKADKVKPLLIGNKAPNLFLIDVKDKDVLIPMGFENCKTSEELTQKFYGNKPQIDKLFKELYAVNSEYVVLVFWDIDCGHCQKEIPKLKKVYDDLIHKDKKVKVVSVYTQHNAKGYQDYITKNNLNWINLYDGAHYNNIVEKYDVVTTPVIYVLDKNKTILAKKIGVEQIEFFVK